MTRASDSKPVRRVVHTQVAGELVVEVYRDVCRLRPLGRRKGVVTVGWGHVYLRAIWDAEDLKRREKGRGKRRKVTRGVRV